MTVSLNGETGDSFETMFGGTAYMLNVTSQKWLDETKAYGVNGAIWTHQVAVIVPHRLIHKNMSLGYVTGACNSNPKLPNKLTDDEFLTADEITWNTGMIAVVVYQIPNCPIVYPSDPNHTPRGEDAMISWAWKEYLEGGEAEFLPRFPMAKAGFKCMEAATEFVKQKGIADIEDGFLVSGASKRGWTTWMMGAATCESCIKIVGIAPLVPIAPEIQADMHRQFQSYNGWTFAFDDYTKLNLTEQLDSQGFINMLTLIDPAYYYDRLERLPKFVIVSSDDEFMQMDWSELWYNKIKGETHLLIAPNSEHSLFSAIPEIIQSLGVFCKSLAMGHTVANRPSFNYTYDNATGELAVQVHLPDGIKVTSVKLRSAETLQTVRRDFRWARIADPPRTTACDPPFIKSPKPISGGANCIAPILWAKKDLTEVTPGGGLYKTAPPEPKDGYWMGYYIEMFFSADSAQTFNFEYIVTTPGYVWPNTLPFKDCTLVACGDVLV